MDIKIIKDTITDKALSGLVGDGEMIKAVVDIKQKTIAVGGELHADAESKLLNEGSKQEDLWGINLYPNKPENERIEYTSFINIRPRQNNRSIEIKDATLRAKIKAVVDQRVKWGQ